LAIFNSNPRVISEAYHFFIPPHLKVHVSCLHVCVEDANKFLLGIPDTNAELSSVPFSSVESLPLIDQIAPEGFDELRLIGAMVDRMPYSQVQT
jgi:hypothetical protein